MRNLKVVNPVRFGMFLIALAIIVAFVGINTYKTLASWSGQQDAPVQMVEITVEQGETLWGILHQQYAGQEGKVDYGRLSYLLADKGENYTLIPGQKLQIPATAADAELYLDK